MGFKFTIRDGRTKPTLSKTIRKHTWADPSDGVTADWYLKIASAHAVLSHERTAELFREYAQGGAIGQRAFKEIAQNNLRLVASVARSYTGMGIDREDVLQEGNLGLMHAIEKFDLSKGNQFSTYALWWIRQRISHYVATQRQSIRLPAHAIRLRKHVLTAMKEYAEANGKPATIEELALATGASYDVVRATLLAGKKLVGLDSHIVNNGSDRQHDDDNVNTFLDANMDRTMLIEKSELTGDSVAEYTELGKHAYESIEELGGSDMELLKSVLFNKEVVITSDKNSTDELHVNRLEFRRAAGKLLKIICKKRGKSLTDEQINNMTKIEGTIEGLEDVITRYLNSQESSKNA